MIKRTSAGVIVSLAKRDTFQATIDTDSRVRRLYIKAINNSSLTCVEGIGYSPPTDDPNEITVYKPRHLRKTAYDDQTVTYTIDSSTTQDITYTWDDSDTTGQTRTAEDDSSGDTETQRVTPNYIIGEQIGAGFIGGTLTDMNTAARQWSRV